jgi:adenylosuccinate synthase
METIPVCVRYLVDGKETDRFPFPTELANAKPVVEYWEGWGCDVSGARRWEDLPRAAREYVQKIEDAVGCPVRYVSVGPERDSIIVR